MLTRWRKAGLVPRAALAGGIAIAFIATVCVAAILALNALAAADAYEGRASRAIDAATRMGEDFLDLHDGVRGFALTNDRGFLAPFWRGIDHLPGDLEATRALMHGERSQQALLDRIATDSQAYIVDYAMPFIAHPRLQDRSRAAFTVAGQGRMDILRAEFNTLAANERARAAKGRAESASSTRRAELIAVGGLVGSTLLLIGLVLASLHVVARPVRRLGDAARRLAEGQTLIVPENGVGEIGQLATAFNSMAAELKARELQLEALTRIDPLTGIANRRGFEEELPRAVAIARRSDAPMSLLMIDLDHFKAYNDGNGHVAGDEFLKRVTSSWQAQLRLSDMLARYGGEEFAVILPDCTLEGAFTLAERLRGAVPEQESCSIGVATVSPSDTPADLIARADAALMTAKRHGRDRTYAAMVA